MEERILPQIPTPCQGFQKVAHTFISRSAKSQYIRPGGGVIVSRSKELWTPLPPRFKTRVQIIVLLPSWCPRSWIVVMSHTRLRSNALQKSGETYVEWPAESGKKRIADQEILRSL